MALELLAVLVTGRAVGEGHMVVSDIIEEVDLVLLQHKTSSNGVNRSIAPTLVEETAILVKRLEIVGVSLGAEPFKAADLKVGPLVRTLAC